MSIYVEIRNHTMPSTEIRCRVDTYEAVTADIIKIIHESITDIIGDFDAEQVKGQLCQLLCRDYARSIYGSTASMSCKTNVLSIQPFSDMAAKCTDAAAELVSKEAEYEVLQEEEKLKERIQHLEEHQMKDLEVQKGKFEPLKALPNFKYFYY